MDYERDDSTPTNGSGPAVSIVVPIYNVERYLRQCLQSIQDQTYANIEVLCVNDGSTDGSADIAAEFAASDPRFIVLDKANGGYGHSANFGIDRACGRYIGIVEPDDFIDAHMYEELLAFAKANPQADIVKGSYWEYFDGRNGFGEELQEPLIMRHMPKMPFAFTLDEYTELFRFHPSIWSAIYKRSFLQQKQIRFIEPAGAGWADNPFFAETMLQAGKIVWVPKPYYYYRQTNDVASSFVNNADIPFDRIADMHAVLERLGATEDVWATQYMRDFSYTRSVVGEFGFSEADPSVARRIRQTLQSMDANIVRTHRMMLSDDIRLYEEFLALPEDAWNGTAAPARAAQPGEESDISFILLVRNDADVIGAVMDSLQACPLESFEIVCVDCGSTDRSMAVCRHRVSADRNIRVLEGPFDAVGEGISAALQAVKGSYVFITDCAQTLDAGCFARLTQQAMAKTPDVVVLSEGEPISADVLLSQGDKLSAATGVDFHAAKTTEGFVPEYVSPIFDGHQCADRLFSCLDPAKYAMLYRTAYAREIAKGKNLSDSRGNGMLGFVALTHAHRLCLAFGRYAQATMREDWNVLFTLEQHTGFVSEPALVLPAVQECVHELGNQAQQYAPGLQDYCLRAFMADLESRKTYESMKAYCDDYLDWLTGLVADTPGRAFAHPQAYDQYQRLVVQGLDSYLALKYFHKDVSTRWNEREVAAWRNSVTMQLGLKVKGIANAVMPRKLLGWIRGGIAGGDGGR